MSTRCRDLETVEPEVLTSLVFCFLGYESPGDEHLERKCDRATSLKKKKKNKTYGKEYSNLGRQTCAGSRKKVWYTRETRNMSGSTDIRAQVSELMQQIGRVEHENGRVRLGILCRGGGLSPCRV